MALSDNNSERKSHFLSESGKCLNFRAFFCRCNHEQQSDQIEIEFKELNCAGAHANIPKIGHHFFVNKCDVTLFVVLDGFC